MNTCIQGDSLAWMAQQREPFADLIIADPPFNIGFKYDASGRCDNLSDSEYLSWVSQWVELLPKMLKPAGNILICINDKYVSDIDIMIRGTKSARSPRLRRLNWIIWHYKFGQSGKLDTRSGFTSSKIHVLRYGKSNKCYFNAPAVAVPSDRLLKYNDKRADKRGKCPDDVFTFKRIAGTHKDRCRGIGTQMPVGLLRIWVRAMCKPGGLVFDPFPGSGASLVAAKLENRNYFGVELRPNYVTSILARLAAT